VIAFPFQKKFAASKELLRQELLGAPVEAG